MNNQTDGSVASSLDCLAGGGRMGALMRSMDWSKTPLGPVEQWPQSLRTSVSICLNSRFVIQIWWGPDLIMIYNDAYIPIAGRNHPTAVGRPGRYCWPEIWDTVGPMLSGVLETGEGIWAEDLRLFLERHGYPEECYFTFSYSPIRDESGGVGGVFTPVRETSGQVIAARRQRTLHDLAARGTDAQTVVEACRTAMRTLGANLSDVPFGLLYLLNADQTEAFLAATAGIEPGADAAPERISLSDPREAAWPLRAVRETDAAVTMDDLGGRFGPLPTGVWDIPPHTAVALPVALSRQAAPAALLVCAVSPHKALDGEYRTFLDLVAAQVGRTLAGALAFEEQGRMVRSLELERSRLAGLFQQAPAFLAVLRGPTHVFETVNPLYLQLVGHRELLGKSVADALPEIVEQGFITSLDDVYRTREPFLANEMPAMLQRQKDAPLEERYVTFVYQPLIEADGSISGIFVHGLDVTESVQTRREVMRKSDELAAADRAKDEFLAMLSHELRNPLGGITNALYLAKTHGAGIPALQKPLETLARQTDNLGRLVNDLLDVARITQSKITLQRKPLSLDAAVTATVRSLQAHVQSKGLELRVETGDAPWVDADPLRLEQILTNLLTNAIKYTDAGSIHVAVDTEGDSAVIRVRDTGAGMSREMLPRVFDLFSQAEGTLDRSLGGLGIGLTLVRRIVAMHGGSVEAQSEGIGHGSTFTVRLPLAERPAADEEAAPGAPEPSPRALRVLVVDDNVDAAEMLVDILEAWGHIAEAAHDGARALETARDHPPDVVLLDIGLPGMDGYEVARRLRGGSTRLVAITGYGQPEDRRRTREAGFDHHLTKPVDLTALQALLALDHA